MLAARGKPSCLRMKRRLLRFSLRSGGCGARDGLASPEGEFVHDGDRALLDEGRLEDAGVPTSLPALPPKSGREELCQGIGGGAHGPRAARVFQCASSD